MTAPAFVILSGDYVAPELVAEFGRLPPSLLPNGGKRLYEAQLDLADALGASTVLVLPEDYELPDFDCERLHGRGVQVALSRVGSTLSESLCSGLAATEGCGDIYLLLGDTLVPAESKWPLDSFAAGETGHVAVWAEYHEQDGTGIFREAAPDRAGAGKVVAGFFHLADRDLLARSASTADGLVSLLTGYTRERPLTPVTSGAWLDFGHLFTYHQSRCRELLARSFNSVTSDGHSVLKSGTPPRKIFAESEWYRLMPTRMRPFLPHLMAVSDGDRVSYEVEYLYLPLLSELYAFARLPTSTWSTMLDSCADFLEAMQSMPPAEHQTPTAFPDLFFDDIIGSKTSARLEAFSADTGLSLSRPWRLNGRPHGSLAGIAERLVAMIRPTAMDDISIWHGDFHFGNIFYDFRSRRVRAVDPRGMLSNGTLTIHGDARYDIAKLGHSVFGLYDFLIAGRYRLDYDGGYDVTLDFGDSPDRERIIAGYAERRIGRHATADQEAIAMVALLFLTMLPLHASDSRCQTALLANAIRLAAMAEAAS